jgi:hypothetical protein
LRPWALALLAGLCLAVALPRAASACSAVWLQTVALQQVAEVPACLALSQAQQVIDTGDPTSPGDMNRRAAVRVQSTCDEAYTIGCDGCVELELPARAVGIVGLPPGQGSFVVTWASPAAAGAFTAQVTGEWSDCEAPFAGCSLGAAGPRAGLAGGAGALAALGVLVAGVVVVFRRHAEP